jgi:hypothetical protein
VSGETDSALAKVARKPTNQALRRQQAKQGAAVRRGVIVGLAFASLYSAFAVVVAAANNGQWRSGEPIPIARTVGAYFFAGTLGGTVVGRMLLDSEGPLRRVRVAGVLAFIIIASLTTAVVGWPLHWGVAEWTAALITAGATACFLFVRWTSALGTEPDSCHR